jgi:sortase (surface protein transpeptidase)
VKPAHALIAAAAVAMPLALGALGVSSYLDNNAIREATVIPAGVSTQASPSSSPVSRPRYENPVGVPHSVPVRISIPAIGVSAPVMTVGLTSAGVDVPPLADHNLAGWYNRSVTPGEIGPSLIDGHVNGYGQESVFARLKDLRKGDPVIVKRANGSSAVFHVTWVQAVAKSQFPWDRVLGWTDSPTLRLVSCGGQFDYATGHYADNIIVYAS